MTNKVKLPDELKGTGNENNIPWYKRKRFWLSLAGIGCVALGGPIPSCLSLAVGV